MLHIKKTEKQEETLLLRIGTGQRDKAKFRRNLCSNLESDYRSRRVVSQCAQSDNEGQVKVVTVSTSND